MRVRRILAAVALLAGLGAGAIVADAGPAAAAAPIPTYIQTGASLIELPGILPLLDPPGQILVLKVNARLSSRNDALAYVTGIRSQHLIFKVGDTQVCDVVTSTLGGSASCTLPLQQQLRALTGTKVTVSFAGTTTPPIGSASPLLPSSAVVPLIGTGLAADPPFVG